MSGDDKKANPTCRSVHDRIDFSVGDGNGCMELQRFSSASASHRSVSVRLSQQNHLDAPGVSSDPPVSQRPLLEQKATLLKSKSGAGIRRIYGTDYDICLSADGPTGLLLAHHRGKPSASDHQISPGWNRGRNSIPRLGYNLLRKVHSNIVSLIISTFLFVILHWPAYFIKYLLYGSFHWSGMLAQSMSALFCGLLFAAMFQKGGTLWNPILAHFYYDWILAVSA